MPSRAGALCEVRYCTDMPDIMLTAASVAPVPIRSVQDVFEAVAAWLNSFTALAGILALIAIMYLLRMLWQGAKKALPVVKSAITFVEALFAMPTFMSETSSQLREIRHEVLPNKGGSLRDDVETVTLLAEKLNEQLTQLHDRDRTDHARLEELEDMINRRRTQRAIIQQGVDSGNIPTYPADTSEE